MVGVILYTILEFINFYLAYRCVFGISFTKKRWPYVMLIASACIVQMLVLYFVDDSWRDVVALGIALVGAIILSERKRWKTLLLYPIVFFLSGFINALGSYGLAAILGITQQMVGDSVALTLLSECTGISVFCIYEVVMKKRKKELSLTIGQYLVLLMGAICFFVMLAFSQGLLNNDVAFVREIKNVTAIASFVIAFVFIGLNIWQQITWKKAMQYRIDNEKYEIYLEGQEEHIRMLILEDEKRRKLRHDMNAHMLALDTMVQKEEWEMLREYLGNMKKSMEESFVNKYTSISAVDAIVDEWHRKALEQDVKWSWEGKLGVTDKVSVFELCTIFSNLLSNAVEAVEKIEDGRRIEVKISNYQERIVISVGNACGIVTSHDGKFTTSKEDKVFHGLGLKNVGEIVKKHEGSIDYNVKDGWFQVDIVL